MAGGSVISSRPTIIKWWTNHQMAEIIEPPAIKHLNKENLNQLKSNALKLIHPCHNQAVE